MTDKIQEEGLEAIALGTKQSQFEAIRKQNQEQYAASGFVHKGKHYSANFVNEGLTAYGNASVGVNNFQIGRNPFSPATIGASKTNGAVVNIAGVVFGIERVGGDYQSTALIKFPPAPDGTVTYDKSSGEVKKHINSATAFDYAALDSANREVVTDRVDIWGFEAFLEEVTKSNPFVYPNGLIQSKATTMDGITTTSGTRPVTYYAVFDGDTTSVGKGLDFFALSEENKKKVVSNSKHNLYYLDDGRLVQWRLRQRTIAGAGNGDWFNIESTISSLMFENSKSFVVAQGAADNVVPYASIGGGRYVAPSNTGNALGGIEDKALFVPTVGFDAVNNQCYFLVCGTVSRLNQGAYHPGFNPLGTALSNWGGGNGGGAWSSIHAHKFTGKSQCFNYIPYTNDTDPGAVDTSGYIGAASGRPDGRFYDAIYADGQGGVCRDMRYSANGLTPVDFDEADLKVKNGTYRGFEKRLFTGLIALSAISTYSATPNQIRINRSDLDLINLVVPDGTYTADGYLTVDGLTARVTSILVNATQIFFNCDTDSVNNGGGRPVSNLVVGYALPDSVGGSFLQTDVIGNPANILQNDALKNGWEGSWVPVIPDGGNKEFLLERKMLSYSGAVYTLDGGVTWVTTYNPPISIVTNSFFNVMASHTVLITQYQAFAKQTESASNEVIYGGKVGTGGIHASNYHTTDTGCLLSESMIGEVLKGQSLKPNVNLLSTLSVPLQAPGNLATSSSWNKILHTSLTLSASENGSHAFKALDYNVNINQQGFKQYAVTELKHDGTDWGDDGKITIVNGESTKTDLNGNTVKVVTHKLKEPIGWIKNEV